MLSQIRYSDILVRILNQRCWSVRNCCLHMVLRCPLSHLSFFNTTSSSVTLQSCPLNFVSHTIFSLISNTMDILEKVA